MIKKLKYMMLFLIMSFSITAADPAGILKVKVNFQPMNGTKLYDFNGKMMIDAGIVNKDLQTINERVIGKVVVEMEAVPNGDLNGRNACVIEGNELTNSFRLDELADAVENSLSVTDLKIYKGPNNAKLSLKGVNYSDKREVIKQDDTEDFYQFSAYPEECNFKNNIKYLSYSFDLMLIVENGGNGDILGGDVIVEAGTGKGALKDMIISHITSIQ